MSVYEENILLRSKDVDLYRRLRLSRLFELLQEASIHHTELLGMGREKTLDKGLLWIVTMQHAEVLRLPGYDERVTLRSWPGKTLRLFFPRYYEFLDGEGRPLVRAGALWMLIEQESRRMVFPERYGVVIEGENRPDDPALPKSLGKTETERESLFTVPFSYVDLNGHMNNTRYFDLAEDNSTLSAAGRELREVSVEYLSEVRYGQSLRLGCRETENEVFLEGTAEKPCFRMRLSYREH